jgi:anti-sigma-K factor RskA
MATTDDDLDALAAEYVLGTLASDERAHAEALIAIDPGFTEIVRQWERRLGELNVMVEAVEPPAEVWDKIKADIDTVAPADEVRLAPGEASEPADESGTAIKTEPATPAASDDKPPAELGGDPAPLLAALASTLMASEDGAEDADQAKAKSEIKPAAAADWTPKPPQPPPSAAAAGTVKPAERGAEIVYLARRLRRWRVATAAAAAIAAVLAAFIVVSQVAPDAFPAGGLFHAPQIFARAPAPAPTAAEANTNRLVAVLQQDPTAPAFLLTIDPANLKLTVRRVSAAADAAHSYELWLISPRFPKPRSLGVVGASEFTQRSLASDYDLATVRSATYKISFEPAGGSKTGQPTGPILYGGKLVEAVPVPPPQAQQPKT